MNIEIKKLNAADVHRANYNSFGGTRGNGTENDYRIYADKIIAWDISETKKQKLLDQLHGKFSEKLKYEAQHVSVMVAGPAKYNAKKLDKSDTILRLSAEFCDWFNDLERQITDRKRESDKAEHYLGMIDFCVNNPAGVNSDPAVYLTALGHHDNAKFIEIYEKLYDRFKWCKNSNICKLYEKSKAGEVQEIKKDVIFQDDNLTAYTEGDRAYIKFIMRPKRQLIVALKSRKWWWNARKNAWSTYLDKADFEWVRTVSERYSDYI